jgi:hypothetical protein
VARRLLAEVAAGSTGIANDAPAAARSAWPVMATTD